MKIGGMRREEYVAQEPEEGWIVSNATLRTEDLIEAFSNELDYRTFPVTDLVFEARVWLEGQEAYWENFPDVCGSLTYEEAGMEIVNDLIDRLTSLAPEGLYFGAHEGDGACFGWWRVEEEWD